MAQDTRGDLYEMLALRGVSRRDFMKFCGATAALLGLSEMAAPQIAAAVEKGAKSALTPAIWLNLGSCTGCTESMAQVDWPDVATVVLDILSLNYFETVMAAGGKQAEDAKAATIKTGGHVAIIEGSVMTGFNGNTLRIADKTGMEHLKEVCSTAAAVVAVGSCAVDGGWVRANPNPAGAAGVMDVAGELGIKAPIINLPTCPVNPEWVVAIVIDALMLDGLKNLSVFDLDEKNRPKLIFGQTIHDNCPRRGHFENNEFVEAFGTPEERKQWCLYKMGCKGPQTKTNCPNVRWNRRANWCVESGAPCIGCGNAIEQNWVDAGTPFLSRLANVNTTLDPVKVGAVLGGATAAGLVVHGMASVATGRTKGVPTEKEKAWDSKHGSQGGDS